MRFETSIERRISARHKALLKFANYTNKRILDIGCSYGWFEKDISEKAKEIIGIDLNKKDLKIARKEVPNKKVTFLEGSVLKIPCKKNYFDIVVMFDVIEHLPKGTEEKALQEIRGVLKPGGKLIISTPANNISKFFDPAWYFGHRHYSVKRLNRILERGKFRIEESKILGGLWEIFSMILFYPYKWIFGSEIPFKDWFDKRREKEYLNNNHGFVTLIIRGIK